MPAKKVPLAIFFAWRDVFPNSAAAVPVTDL